MQHDDNAVPNEGKQTITDDSDGNGYQTRKPDPWNPGLVYHAIGMITIILGIIVGIYLLVTLYNQQPALFPSSKSELTFGEVIIALGASLIFIVPGVICIGVGKVIDLLDK